MSLFLFGGFHRFIRCTIFNRWCINLGCSTGANSQNSSHSSLKGHFVVNFAVHFVAAAAAKFGRHKMMLLMLLLQLRIGEFAPKGITSLVSNVVTGVSVSTG